jgi:hypothetical protein
MVCIYEMNARHVKRGVNERMAGHITGDDP